MVAFQLDVDAGSLRLNFPLLVDHDERAGSFVVASNLDGDLLLAQAFEVVGDLADDGREGFISFVLLNGLHKIIYEALVYEEVWMQVAVLDQLSVQVRELLSHECDRAPGSGGAHLLDQWLHVRG